MLTITIPSAELFDDRTQEFIETKPYIIQLEHSLVSISKWESRFNKPFLGKDPKTTEETIYYIKCMTITQNVPDIAYNCLTSENINQINTYIESPMTATTFNNLDRNNSSREIVTSELIYYWMVSLNIPLECQKWHLNRLLTLIRVCNVKNTPPKKMSKRDIINRNASLNAARRKQHHTKG